MKLQIKYKKEKFSIDIDGSLTIKDLKRQIAKIKNCKISQIRLIYVSDILQNSEIIESKITDPNKTVDLYISESKFTSKSKSIDLINNPSLNQFSQYISEPKIQSLISDQDVQNGLKMIQQGLQLCHDSGNNNYDDLLQNIKLIVHYEPYTPTPPPSSSPSNSTLSTPQTNSDEFYKEKYKEQLNCMEEMGLTDQDVNLKALIKFNGDLDDALNYLIQENILTE